MPTGFYFCICPDAALSLRHVRSALLPSMPDAEVKYFWGDEGLTSAFWSALSLVSFVRMPKILIVRSAHLLPAEDWRKLSSALGTPHADVLPVFFMERKWEKGKPKLPKWEKGKSGEGFESLKCYAYAKEKKWIWMYGGLDRASVRSFIEKEMRGCGLQCDAGVLNYLAEIMLPDASAIKSMLDQLVLVAENGKVTSSIVRQLAACAPEAVIFDLVNYIEQGNASRALLMLENEGDGGEGMFFPLLSLLSREARILWQLHAGDDASLQPLYYAAEKKRLAKKLGFGGITRMFSHISHADMVVKSGEQKTLSALEELVINLVFLFRGDAAGRKAR